MPGVDGAVLQTALSLINSLTHSSFSSKCSKHLHSQTIKAREVKFLENVKSPSHVKSHASHVTCLISCVICQMSGALCTMSITKTKKIFVFS